MLTNPTAQIDHPKIAPYAPWPYYSPEEVAAVVMVMESGKVNYWSGEEARQFEREFAAAAGCDYAVAVCNGTSALELAIHGLDIPAGSEIITTPRTFIASASCAVMRGCVPVLAEVDPCSQNITANSIERVITPKTKAIIAVHLAGWPCDMDPIMDLAQRHGLKVIEDCAQASGATYKGRPVGSLGHVAAFSFCQDKIITTGGERAWAFKDHGKSWDAVYTHQHPPGYGFRWLHESFGTNWRMTEIQAAIGRIQLRKLPDWIRIRRANFQLLNETFSRFACLRVPQIPEEIGHAAYKGYVFLQPDGLRDGWNRDRIVNELQARGVPCLSGSCSEIYLEKAFTTNNLGPTTRYPVARELGETSLMFQVHPTLTAENLAETAETLVRVFEQASK